MYRLRITCIAGFILLMCCAPFRVSSQEKAPPAALSSYPNSADGLKALIQDILDAAKSHDTSKETRLIHGLILPSDTSWFNDAFGLDLGEQASLDYQDLTASLESDLRRVLEGDVQKGLTDPKILTITDPESVEHPVDNVLNDMEPSLPLYEVILSGRGCQSFDIQFDKHGKGFQSSGDPNGYFFFIAGGFHFVPTEALLHLPDGRPAPGHKQPLLPKLVHSAPAVYPDAARKAKVSGTVKMHLVVDVNGKVIRVTVKDGDPRLVKAAEDAVRKWEFKAPRVDGKPIQSEIDAEVSFSFY